MVVVCNITLAAVPGFSHNPATSQCEDVLDNAEYKTLPDCETLNFTAGYINLYYEDPSHTLQADSGLYTGPATYSSGNWRRNSFWYSKIYNQDDCQTVGAISMHSDRPELLSDSLMESTIQSGNHLNYLRYAPCVISIGSATSSAYFKDTNGLVKLHTNISTTTPTCTINCNSNILFLPGIMGSRLYEDENGTQKERWANFFDVNQARLEMDSNGYSINNLYTSTSTGIVDEVGITNSLADGNIYKSFLGDLKNLKATSTSGTAPLINDYSLIPYDWRLPLNEIVANGKEVDGKVYYGSTVPNLNDSFIVKELQRLVTGSKTGKVTVVAHSNGGLVTKELIQQLKETNNPLYDKIDKVIFVAVPQVGTPDAVLGLLHGTDIGYKGVYVSPQRTRQLLNNMPVGYNLLPSETYFNNLSPLVEFSPAQISQNLSYGSTINTYQEYIDYLKGTEGRTTPDYSDTISPAKANPVLLQNAIDTHQRLDSWLPATSTEVYQIAGWGIYTPSGIKYSDVKECAPQSSQYLASTGCVYTTKTTVSEQLKYNGDGTVLSGSAQEMGESSQVKNYWVDMLGYKNATSSILGVVFNKNTSRKHKDILEVSTLRDFIKNIITSPSPSLPQYVSTTEPVYTYSDATPYATYRIHSPLHLTVIDNQGNITGYSTSTGQILENIKGSQYLESADVKTVLLPKDTPHQVILTAYASGSFTLEASTLNGNDVVQTTVFEAIPTSTSTVAILTNTGTGVSASTPLTLDFDGNGTTDKTISTQTGQTAVYDTTPPELQLTFSTSTKDVLLSAIDNIDQNPSLTMGTSTVTLKDSQNNTTIINFKKLKDTPTKLVLVYNQITRNGIATTTPNTRIEYDWALKNDGTIKDLDTKAIIKGIEKTIFNYKKQNNQTTVKNKSIQTGQVVTTTQSGFVSVTVLTSSSNLLNVSY